ncbi:MAG: hypothetical protein JSV16_14880, partial [Candidatus Hydrogenedentota bacterium]
MRTISRIETRRHEILTKMSEMYSVRRGTINEQHFKVSLKRTKVVVRGPYYIVPRNEGNKTVSTRLRLDETPEQARQDVAAHKRFKERCKEFEELTDL